MEIRHKKLRVVGAFVIAVFVLVIVLGTFWYLNKPRTDPVSSRSSTQSATSEQPKAITVNLPNATPVTAIKEDYDSDASLWRIVSKDYPYNDSHYVPSGLELATVSSRTDKSNEERSLRADIMPAVEKLFTAMTAQGYDMMIGSGYRSYDLQNMYYTNYVKASGEAAANQFSAKPGQSEHQSGLAFDISYQSRQCYLDTCFGDTEAGKWIQAHSYEYGFIVRYPKDKTTVTKYMYEPWHLRYVGTELAKALHDSGLTLDEARPYLQTALKELKDTKAIPSS